MIQKYEYCKCGIKNFCTICRDPNKHNCIFLMDYIKKYFV